MIAGIVPKVPRGTFQRALESSGYAFRTGYFLRNPVTVGLEILLALGLRLGNLRPVAGLALLRSGLVEKNLFAVHLALRLMTIAAADIAVRPLQRKLCPAVMVEQGWAPLGGVVAIGTRSCALGIHELFAMRVLMALFANGRRTMEIDVEKLGFEVRRLVAAGAIDCAVSTDELEFRRGMIEARQVPPGLRTMAGFTTEHFAIDDLAHAVAELFLVGILVTAGAIERVPMIQNSLPRLLIGSGLMALGARDREMPPGERKPGFFVLRQ